MTYLRCGGKFIHDFVANLPLSLLVKVFRKSVNIWRSYGQEFSVLFFLTHGVVVCCNPNQASVTRTGYVSFLSWE